MCLYPARRMCLFCADWTIYADYIRPALRYVALRRIGYYITMQCITSHYITSITCYDVCSISCRIAHSITLCALHCQSVAFDRIKSSRITPQSNDIEYNFRRYNMNVYSAPNKSESYIQLFDYFTCFCSSLSSHFCPKFWPTVSARIASKCWKWRSKKFTIRMKLRVIQLLLSTCAGFFRVIIQPFLSYCKREKLRFNIIDCCARIQLFSFLCECKCLHRNGLYSCNHFLSPYMFTFTQTYNRAYVCFRRYSFKSW